MKSLIAVVALSTSLTAQSASVIKAGTTTPADLALAVASVPRFAVDKFGALPPSVRDAFTAMNCQVPQNSLTGGPANLVDGEFAANGQRDWAALCSNSTVTEIRVVWGGPARCEDRHASRQDSDSMVAKPPSLFTYARRLAAASPEHVARYLTRHRAKLSEHPAHDALEDSNGSASLVYYCYGGHWQMIPGAG